MEQNTDKPTVLITPPNAFSENDKANLKEAGYVVVETADPSQIKWVNQLELITGDDMVDALLWSMTQANSGPTHKGYVGEYLVKKLIEKRKITKP